MNVRNAMNPEPPTVAPTATVAEVGRVMLEQDVDGVPVVGAAGELLGMVTRADLVAKHAKVHLPLYFAILGTVVPIDRRRTDADMRRVLATTAQDLMDEDVPTISPDSGLDDAATMMEERRTSAIPVTENGRLVGLIDHADIIRILLVEEGDGDQTASP
jgi:CBS domain-containing protein